MTAACSYAIEESLAPAKRSKTTISKFILKNITLVFKQDNFPVMTNLFFLIHQFNYSFWHTELCVAHTSNLNVVIKIWDAVQI